LEIKTKVLSVIKIIGVWGGFYLIFIGISFPLQLIFSASFRNSNIWGIIGTGILTALTIGYHFLILKIFGKKDKPKCGFALENNWLKHFLGSILLGIICILLIWALIVLFNGYTIRLNEFTEENINYILVFFGVMLLIGFQEEITTRGYMAYVGKTGGKWFAAIIISIIFTFSHSSGELIVLFYINLFIWSIIAFILTWITGDLWSAIGFHFSWNMIMGCILGVSVSGKTATGILVSEYNEGNIINGGEIGLEGSIICTIVLIALLCILFITFKKGKFKNKSNVLWLINKKETNNVA